MGGGRLKLAIIPPLCYPYEFGSDNYKLILPQLWDVIPTRQKYFEATMLNHRRGGFTILDNGAAESKPYDWDELLKLARRFHVNEVVLPDVMGDTKATREAVEKVFADTWHPVNHFGLMGVIQGTDPEEIYDLIKFYLGMQGRTLTSIGIPRCLIRSMDVDQARLLVAKWIRTEDEQIPIHLLGTDPEYIWELRDFGRYFRALGVRGVDTSAPFVYAAGGEWIGSGAVRKRTEDYFDLPRDSFNKQLLEQNIATLKEWVHG
jgi:hypothetical protein